MLWARITLALVVSGALAAACGNKPSSGFAGQDGGANTDGSTSSNDPDFEDDGGFKTDAPVDPCAVAAENKSYVGCEYWPTVTANPVQSIFDFTIAAANVGTEAATVTVTGPGGFSTQAKVAGGELAKIYLPWVKPLKGDDFDDPAQKPHTNSVVVRKGAYHVVSDRPIVLYQFNALEFKAQGGPPGKNWALCQSLDPFQGGCFSYSNDASLLIPTAALTGNYRIIGSTGFSRHPQDPFGGIDTSKPLQDMYPPYFTVTATKDDTKVIVKLAANGKVMASTGGEIAATSAGGTVTFKLDAGDVAEVVSGLGRANDFGGTLLTADKPVQVLSGVPCMDVPLDVQACDHVEEVVFPAETLGKHYIVVPGTGPKANIAGHVVRFFGNVDGTTLSYKPSKPSGCPDTINAGDVIECGIVKNSFEVTGDKEFAVVTLMLGGELLDPDFGLGLPDGDPSMSLPVTVEQYRTNYLFLAPTDYTTNYVDVIGPSGVAVKLDGEDVSSKFQPIAGTSYVLGRLLLGYGADGAHTLEAEKPVGIQVLGYGSNTSYQYPGGLNLDPIAPVPH